MTNLDKIAAERAQQMALQTQNISGVKKPIETLERLVTKALGVLQSQGVYACMLFLFSRTGDENKIAPVVLAQLFEALKSLSIFADAQVPEANSRVRDALCFYSERVAGDDLDTLLLVRDLYEQTLIYARYHARALGG